MTTAHDFTVNTLAGKERPLSTYAGKALLVVNVASKCGLTPQYKALEALHQELSGKGVAVLGFPCNQFGAQEPGSAAEIEAFCTKNYGVSFDMFEKVDVNGDKAHPLYQWLTEGGKKPIAWNFGKFVVDKAGNVVARFEPQVAPDAPEVKAALEKARA